MVARVRDAVVRVRTRVPAAIENAATPLLTPPLMVAWLARLASSGPVQPNPATMNPNP